MNTIVTSKEEILKNSRELIREKGWAAVSIRSVASACGVSVGSIYNYYDSKAELISATVESVWCEIFHRPQDEAVFQDVQTCVKWPTAMSSIPDSSHCTLSALCRRTRPMANGTCSKSGTIS